jgi:hypothetical protein
VVGDLLGSDWKRSGISALSALPSKACPISPVAIDYTPPPPPPVKGGEWLRDGLKVVVDA